MKSIFSQEPSLLEFDGEIIVVGDIHGYYLDLCRILKTFQLPVHHKYLFLGDLVDRGEFSFETVFIIFILKYLYPKSVYIIRGNHEFQSVCSNSRFLSELKKIYKSTKIFLDFMGVFAYLPLGTIIQNKFICIHGGLSQDFVSPEQIKSLERPISDYDEYPFLSGIVWSDPSENVCNFLPNPRKVGQLFGSTQVNAFLRNNYLLSIIRGHQCVKNGIETMFENKLITVFSASNYCGKNPNRSGILLIHENGEIEKRTFPHFEYYRREMAHFDFGPKKDYLVPSLIPQPLKQINKTPTESNLAK
jgi:protein phosphatase